MESRRRERRERASNISRFVRIVIILLTVAFSPCEAKHTYDILNSTRLHRAPGHVSTDTTSQHTGWKSVKPPWKYCNALPGVGSGPHAAVQGKCVNNVLCDGNTLSGVGSAPPAVVQCECANHCSCDGNTLSGVGSGPQTLIQGKRIKHDHGEP